MARWPARRLVLALALATSGGAGAAAEPPPARIGSDEAPATPSAGTWYGWQIFLADAASATAFYLSVQGDSAAGATLAGAGYLAGGPVIRLAHGDGPGAGASLVRRLLFPPAAGLVFGLVGAATSSGKGSEFCGEGCAVGILALVGAGAGAAAAMVYDWVTAREAPPPEPSATSPSLAPVVVATRRVTAVGLALRF